MHQAMALPIVIAQMQAVLPLCRLLRNAAWGSKQCLTSAGAFRQCSSGSGTKPDAAAVKLAQAEKMIDLISKSPQMQQMFMAQMPAFMRTPAVMQEAFSNPFIRKQVAAAIASRDMAIAPEILERLTPENVDATFQRAQQMGMNPTELFSKLTAHPDLLKRLNEPAILAAFTSVTQNPASISNYDAETKQVIFRIRDILTSGSTTAVTGSEVPPPGQPSAPVAAVPPPPGQPAQEQIIALGTSESGLGNTVASNSDTTSQPEAPTQSSASSSTASRGSGSSTSQEPQGVITDTAQSPTHKPYDGVMNPLVAILLSDSPESARMLDNPDVRQALDEVNGRPWRTLAWIFNRPVMDAFQVIKKGMTAKGKNKK